MISSRVTGRRRRRTARAYTLAEFGPTLILAFCILVFPILAFGMIGARILFVYNAARLAVTQAARCKTFLANNAPNFGSVTTAKSIAAQALTGNGTIQLTKTDVYIKVCPYGGGPATVTTPGPNTPLPAPADTAANSYNCECQLFATVDPLFPGATMSFLGSIPGFNAPIPANVRMDCFFENTTNLNQ